MFLVELSQYIHDTHGPRVLWSEDLQNRAPIVKRGYVLIFAQLAHTQHLTAKLGEKMA